MIEQQAQVVKYDKDVIWLQAERTSTCDGCKLKKGCGTGLLSKHVGKRLSQIEVANTRSVEVGQQVQLTIPEEALLSGTFLMYIVPLLSLFAMSMFAQLAHLNEFMEIIFGLSGLLIGFYWVRYRLKSKTHNLQAKIKIEDKP